VIDVMLTAPLGFMGVAIFLIVFNKPFGFVAMLGMIALSGRIMPSSVILIDQVGQDIAADHDSFEAVTDATVRRISPIVLAVTAAVLAMIPLVRFAFFSPMAVAITGGLLVAMCSRHFSCRRSLLPGLVSTPKNGPARSIPERQTTNA